MTEHVSTFSSPELRKSANTNLCWIRSVIAMNYLLIIIVAARVFSLPASQSLRASASSQGPGALPTGLRRLDEALAPFPSYEFPESTQSQRVTGIPRGQVTEIYGPPGVGKTAVA